MGYIPGLRIKKNKNGAIERDIRFEDLFFKIGRIIACFIH